MSQQPVRPDLGQDSQPLPDSALIHDKPSDKPLSSRPLSVPAPRHTGRKAALAIAVLVLASGVALFKGPALFDGKDTGSFYKVESPLGRVSETTGASTEAQAPAPSAARIELNAIDLDARKQNMQIAQQPAAPAAEGLLSSGGAKEKAVVDGKLPPLRGDKTSRSNFDAGPGTSTSLPQVGDFGHGYNVSGYLIKQGSMQIEVSDIQASFGKISDLSERYKGYLVDSSLSHPEHGQAVATLHIKLPATRLTAALAELDALGTVRSKQIKTEDIWLKLKQQQLEIEKQAGDIKAVKPGASKRNQEYLLKLEQLERVRLEQMLRMATLELQLHEKPALINLAPLGPELGYKLSAAISNSVRLLAEVLMVLPPLLIFLGLAWLGWLILKNIMITRLALLQPKTLAGIYLLGVVFFPLAATGGGALGMALSFGLLLGAIWSLMTLGRWVKARMLTKAPVTVTADVTPPSPELPI